MHVNEVDVVERQVDRAQGWRLHQLRHSMLTHEAENGTSTPTLLARSRHAPLCARSPATPDPGPRPLPRTLPPPTPPHGVAHQADEPPAATAVQHVPEVLRPRTCGSRCGHPGEQTRGSASHTRRGQRPGADPTRLLPLHLLRRPRVPGRPHPTDQPRRPRHSRQPRPGVPGLQQRQAREAAHRMAPRPRRVRGRFITQDRGRTSTPTKPQTGAGALTSTCRRLRHQPVAQQMSPEGRAPVNGSRVLFLGASPVGSGLLDRSGLRLSLTPGFTCRSTAEAGRVDPG